MPCPSCDGAGLRWYGTGKDADRIECYSCEGDGVKRCESCYSPVVRSLLPVDHHCAEHLPRGVRRLP